MPNAKARKQNMSLETKSKKPIWANSQGGAHRVCRRRRKKTKSAEKKSESQHLERVPPARTNRTRKLIDEELEMSSTIQKENASC